MHVGENWASKSTSADKKYGQTVLKLMKKYKVHQKKKKTFNLEFRINSLITSSFPSCLLWNIMSPEFLSDESVPASFASQEDVSAYQRMVAFLWLL